MEVTGERLLPDQQRGELVHAEHLARYRFAAQFAAGARTLDAASGEGYGTAILAAAGARRVVGVDIEVDAVEHARQKYGLEFERGDVSDLPFETNSFDLVVSFETLEHVDDAARAVAEFERVLVDGGTLIASTPNADTYTCDNAFHKREFKPNEFAGLLHERFGQVSFFYQQDWLVSAVLDEPQFTSASDGTPLTLDLLKIAEHQPGDQLFSVAVCGPAGGNPVATGVATAIFEAQRMLEWVDRALKAERDLQQWMARATDAERLQNEWQARATEAERLLEETRAMVDKIERSASWRMTAPLRSAKSRFSR